MLYEIEVRHEGLNKYRVIRGSNPDVLEQKAQAQMRSWEAQEALLQIENTLVAAVDVACRIGWEKLKDVFDIGEPRPEPPEPVELPEEPMPLDPKYQNELGIGDRFASARRRRTVVESLASYRADRERWISATEEVTRQNNARTRRYEENLRKWESDREQFLQERKAVERRYLNGDGAATIEYCRGLLTDSKYPDSFPREYDIHYNPENRILIVECRLPSPEHIPRVKEVKYVQSRDEFVESRLADSAFNKMYDDLLYKIALRSIYVLYDADVAEAIDSIVFNGWVNSIDKATGQQIRPCVLSVQAGRDEFLSINLAQVDPKACFRELKGIAASKLHALSPVPPVMTIDREDARFVAGHEVGESLDESENIAAMDWQDFEHLIRELFEKEFSAGGGEVNVTRASRDYGVDAIAFDPDPIRGGKIVIQAKRYTNVVGVAAVRDLYGTVINEGATKGILITTADYGPDAYGFAKGKPLTLLSGGNLLHLLQKHGHKARIDLKEAKQTLAEREG